MYHNYANSHQTKALVRISVLSIQLHGFEATKEFNCEKEGSANGERNQLASQLASQPARQTERRERERDRETRHLIKGND